MNTLWSKIKNLFTPVEPLDPGTYQYQSGTTRYHLRIEPDGQGLMIINASTVLHLNQTAAEYAFYHLEGKTPEEAGNLVASRYQISPAQAEHDYQNLVEKIDTLLEMPDLDPVTFLGLERETPYAGAVSAPYRLDCALTYQLPEESNPDLAPTRRVDRELTTEEWQTIISKAWEAGIPHLIFTGGEPTLREDLLDLIQYAEEKGQVTGVLSDGLRLADEAYFHQLLQTGADHLMIALDPENETVWQALEIILPEDIFTTVHLTISERNASRVPSILERLSDMGTNALSLSIRTKDDPALKEALENARDMAAELGLSIKWDLPVPYSAHNPVSLELEEADEVSRPKSAGVAWCYVEPDGDVLPGQGINEIMGNLLEEPWDAIWDQGQSG
jgi:pyruvate-formate lyase-activating enzyme